MFNALRLDAGKDITGELGIIRTSAGAAYLIICSELGARQHRHVLPLFPQLFVMARDVCKEMDLSRCADFVLELPQLIAHVAKLDTMRSVKGEQVRDVDVSIWLPYEARARYSSMDGSEHGRSAYCH